MTGSGDENDDIEEFELKRYEEYPPEFFDLIIIDECHMANSISHTLGRAVSYTHLTLPTKRIV